MRMVELKKKVFVPASEGVHGHWKDREPVIAAFHQFGVDYEEFESGPGNFTVAVVELPDGTVEKAQLHEIRFID